MLQIYEMLFKMSLSGSQGNVKRAIRKGVQVIIKQSKYIDYTIELEASVLRRIAKCKYLSPHFAKCLSMTNVTRKGVKIPQISMNEIQNGEEFNSLIRRKLKSSFPMASDIVVAITCMTLCVCEQLRLDLGIVHNDLHTSNIIVVKTEKETISYQFPDGRLYEYRTFGYMPIIIDFGYAFVEGSKMLAPSFCMDIGYSTSEQDCLADSRILLSKVTELFKRYSTSEDKTAKKFIGIVDELFKPLSLDNNGWFTEEYFINIIDELLCIVRDQMMDTTSVFNYECSEAEDLINLFIAQIVPPSEDYYVDDLDQIYKNALDKFKIFKTKCMECPQFVGVGPRKQLAMIKSWLSLSTDYCMDVVEAFKPILYAVVTENRTLKRDEYSKLSVKTTLDVLDLLR